MKRKKILTGLLISFTFLALFFMIFYNSKTSTKNNSFVALCKDLALNRKSDNEICDTVHEKFLKKSSQNTLFVASDFSAPELPTDKLTKMIVIGQPNHLPRLAYCYFQFRGWFDPQKFKPQEMRTSVTGFAILKNELTGYSEWLQSTTGAECRQSIHQSFGENILDLKQELDAAEALLAINPLAQINQFNSISEMLNDAQLTTNHERVHIMQVLCKPLTEFAIKMWQNAPDAKKIELREKYPSYDWSNNIVAYRENLAIEYESRPLEVLKLADCKY